MGFVALTYICIPLIHKRSGRRKTQKSHLHKITQIEPKKTKSPCSPPRTRLIPITLSSLLNFGNRSLKDWKSSELSTASKSRYYIFLEILRLLLHSLSLLLFCCSLVIYAARDLTAIRGLFCKYCAMMFQDLRWSVLALIFDKMSCLWFQFFMHKSETRLLHFS